MKLPRPVSGKNYFVSIFVIGALIFIAFSSVLYRQYTDARVINEQAIQDYEMLRRARLIYIHLLNLETGTRGYLLTGKKDFLAPYETSQKMLEEHVNAVKAMALGQPEIQQKLDAVYMGINKFTVFLRSQIETYDSKGKNAVTSEVLDSEKQQMDMLRKQLEAFLTDSRFSLEKLVDQSAAKNREFIFALLIGTVLAVGAMLLATLIMLSLLARSRQAEEDVQESEERLLAVMNGLNDGLFDYNVKEKTVYFSPSYKAMLGYSEEEFPNTSGAFREHVHPDDGDVSFETKAQRVEREKIYSRVFRMLHKSGTWRWILSRGVGVWNDDGELVRLIGAHTDITEQKNREEELKQLNTDMESFIYIASHDLRSPLVNLKGFAGEIEHALRQTKPALDRAKLKLPDEDDKILSTTFEKDIPESLNFISKAVEKMDKLTSAVLDLSRIGKRELRVETIDNNALIRRCLESLAYVITQKDAEVICNPLPPIVSDGLALEHIFNNLLDNAVKYLSPERKGKIVISAQTAGKDIIFSVKDNGRGIAREDRKKIFEIFRRARNTGDVYGLGMGMAYVKATTRKLGGSIWLDTTFGEGTTFYVRLPAYLEIPKAIAGDPL
jgi:PAS domain S-box-containing protein